MLQPPGRGALLGPLAGTGALGQSPFETLGVGKPFQGLFLQATHDDRFHILGHLGPMLGHALGRITRMGNDHVDGRAANEGRPPSFRGWKIGYDTWLTLFFTKPSTRRKL
jgi:hypothetical protein